MSALNELAPEIGLAPACAALRINRARIYRQDARRRLLISPRQPTPRPPAPLALSAPERQGLLDVLYSERFADCAPYTVYAQLLDEGGAGEDQQHGRHEGDPCRHRRADNAGGNR